MRLMRFPGTALGFGALALLGTALTWADEPAAPKGADATAAASFKPSAAQLAALKIVTVGRTAFRVAHVTDGKIALNPDRTTPVFSPYTGRVTQLLARLGERVHQGQPLLALQAVEFVQGQSDLLAGQATVQTARAQLALAQSNERRKRALFDAKAGSLQDWEQSQSELAAAQSSLDTAQAALAAVRNRLSILGKSDAEIDALTRAQKMDPVAYVLAPIDGIVLDKQVGLGQYVQAGASTPVYTVGDLSTVWLVANVRESDVPSIRLGASVEVRVAALPERVFPARITYVGSVLDAATRRLSVSAEIANADGALKPEMFATFSILSGGTGQATSVPESAVIYEGADAHVWVAAADGSLALRQIRPGRAADGMVEVLAGVRPGERVVSAGALFIDRAAEGQ